MGSQELWCNGGLRTQHRLGTLHCAQRAWPQPAPTQRVVPSTVSSYQLWPDLADVITILTTLPSKATGASHMLMNGSIGWCSWAKPCTKQDRNDGSIFQHCNRRRQWGRGWLLSGAAFFGSCEEFPNDVQQRLGTEKLLSAQADLPSRCGRSVIPGRLGSGDGARSQRRRGDLWELERRRKRWVQAPPER